MSSNLRFLLLLGLVVVAGCKRRSTETEPYKPPPRVVYSVSEYSSVCSGTAVESAPAYVKGAAPSKVAVFEKYLDDKKSTYANVSPPGLEALSTDKPDAVALVVCVDLTRKDPAAYCNFNGAQLLLYDMTHAVRVLEAKTGKELLKEEFTLDRKTQTCPGSFTFPNGVTSLFRGADYGSKLLFDLLPFEPATLALPQVKASALDAVCSGSAVPQAHAYDPQGKTPRKIRTVFFATSETTFTRYNRPNGMPDDSASGSEDAAGYELVACITGKPQKKKQDCQFTSGKVLEIDDGEFEVRFVEAHSGKAVATKTFKGTSRQCPLTHEFWGAHDQRITDIEPAFAKHLASLAAPKR